MIRRPERHNRLTPNDNSRFSIFRRADAVDFDASGAMSPPDEGTFDAASVARLVEAGVYEGSSNDLVFSGSGMSLARVWFKSGYPLPRHSHDCDCLYYILAGSIRLGVEDLGPGDGFFVGADVPYSYVAGENGVELLEFRNATRFGITLLGANARWGDKAVAQVEARRAGWRDEKRPSET